MAAEVESISLKIVYSIMEKYHFTNATTENVYDCQRQALEYNPSLIQFQYVMMPELDGDGTLI